MYRRCYLIVAVFSPLVVFAHFIWPLSNCVLADICNHTWIPECGLQVVNKFNDTKLFIDDCDMYEYNCDKNQSYNIVNYSDCFGAAVACPKNKFRRIGDYKYQLDGRKMVYDPIGKPFNPSSLPKRMLQGKRRYNSDVRKRIMRERIVREYYEKKKNTKKPYKKPMTKKPTTKVTTTKTTTQEITTTTESARVITATETYVIRKEVVIKNGRKVLKVIKGVRLATNNDFLE